MAALGSQQADERQRLARAAAEVLADYERVLAENGRLLAENEALRGNAARAGQGVLPLLDVARSVTVTKRRNIRVYADGRAQIDFSEKRGKKRRRFRKTFASLGQAELALSKAKVDIYAGNFLPPRRTEKRWNEVADEWLASKSALRPNSLLNWQIEIDRLRPLIGDVLISSADLAPLERARDALLREMKPRRVNAYLQRATAVWKFAMKRQWTDANPMALVDRVSIHSRAIDPTRDEAPVAVRARPQDILSPEDVGRLIEAAEPGLARAAIMTAALTGPRRGELFALRWADVRLDDARLDIQRSLARVRVDGVWALRFYSPKTPTGVRTVPMPEELVAELRRWKLACPPSDLDLVFPAGQGAAPMSAEWFIRHMFKPALRRAQLRTVQFKALRHGFASMLIAQGANPAEVSHYLGHTSPAFTLSQYVRWFGDRDSGVVHDIAKAVLSRGGVPHRRPPRSLRLTGKPVASDKVGH